MMADHLDSGQARPAQWLAGEASGTGSSRRRTRAAPPSRQIDRRMAEAQADMIGGVHCRRRTDRHADDEEADRCEHAESR